MQARKNEALNRKWERFVRQIERGSVRWDDSLGVDPMSPLWTYRGNAKPRRLLFVENNALFLRWREDGTLPAHWIVLTRRWFPGRQYIEEIVSSTARHQLPLIFVGGLIPANFVIFEMLRRAVQASSSTRKRHVVYGGIDDRWLALCDRHRPKDEPEERFQLDMDRGERRLFDVVCELIPDLEELIGPRSMAILRSGRTFHVEGAVGPSIYGERFPAVIAQHLDRLPIPRSTRPARRARRQRVGSTTE